jgi:16S rRNA (guanine527-N7)-methyltransferase
MTENSPGPLTLLDVWTHLSMNDVVLSKEQMESLKRYHDELVYWNERVNMVSRKDVEQLWERHIIHSLLLLRYITLPQKARVLDVGTGGGLPGIPIKIARPDVKITLVDSTAKKIKLVEMFGQHTGLKDITALAVRAEDLASQAKYRKVFNVIISRAVAPIVELVDWTHPMLNPSGSYAFLKGGDLTAEIAEAKRQYPTLTITETLINAVGLPHFSADEKKVITCRFS